MFEKLGRFQIKRLLGQGAMGEVYLALDPTIGREVAIKTILPTAAQGPEAKARFEREARAAGALNHPHLVTIYEFGEDQGVLYIAMEYLEGQDLEELFRQRMLSPREALEVLAQACDGLNFAHRHGIVHRDIKPANVRVTRDGKRLHAKVMDFGVARISNSDMTATGMVMGTVSYMAPEYIRTGKPDSRSDLFAIGVMLYEALSGRKPFAGDTTPTILYKIVNEAPEALDARALQGLSPAIRRVLDRALAKDPEARFQTAEDLARALRAVQDPTWRGDAEEATSYLGVEVPTAPMPLPAAPHPRHRSRTALAIGLGCLALLAGGSYAAHRFLGTRRIPSKGITPAMNEASAASTAHPVSTMPPKAVHPPPESPQGTPPSRIAPTPPPREEPQFAPEALRRMDVPERKSLSNLTMSEAIQLADKDPTRALEGLRNAISANPTNPNAYAWTIALLYENGRYSEIPPVFAKARQHGISRTQMNANLRFRMAMNREALNHSLPGEGDQ